MEDEFNAVSIFQVSQYLKSLVDESNIDMWMVGEVYSLSVNRHCYLELVEKSSVNGEIVAKLKACLWQRDVRRVMGKFERETGKTLAVGMKIMIRAKVQYSEVFGMSAIMSDINAEFSIGDMERMRRETLKKLKEDGVIDMQKTHTLPRALQKIAVVSSETAAGYGDFVNQLENNQYGLKFNVTLYPALVQGNDAPASIIDALDKIASESDVPDIVAIIRGGGSRSDLLCFDDYDLASNIAQFPCPIVTGIGHERDESVADMVSFLKVKTPTAVAEFLIDYNARLLRLLDELAESVRNAARESVSLNQRRFEMCAINLRNSAYSRIVEGRSQCDILLNRVYSLTIGKGREGLRRTDELIRQLRIVVRNICSVKSIKQDQIFNSLQRASIQRVLVESKRVEKDAAVVAAYNPMDILNRGFTMTMNADGERVVRVADVAKGMTIKTLTSDGVIVSVVTD